MKETTQQREYSTGCTLYLAMELSEKKWKLDFTVSLGQKAWKRRVEAGDLMGLEQANAPTQRGETPQEQRIVEVRPIAGQANLSTDGGMVLIRSEGWKEVKLTTISEVEVRPA